MLLPCVLCKLELHLSGLPKAGSAQMARLQLTTLWPYSLPTASIMSTPGKKNSSLCIKKEAALKWSDRLFCIACISLFILVRHAWETHFHSPTLNNQTYTCHNIYIMRIDSSKSNSRHCIHYPVTLIATVKGASLAYEPSLSEQK